MEGGGKSINAESKALFWSCRREVDGRLDTEGMFTGIGLKGNAAATVHESIRRLGCLAPVPVPVPVPPVTIRACVGVKSWVPDSLDPLFVAGNLPGGILIERRGT
jgi:hypothetical protein